jgi:hypothetical protein
MMLIELIDTADRNVIDHSRKTERKFARQNVDRSGEKCLFNNAL